MVMGSRFETSRRRESTFGGPSVAEGMVGPVWGRMLSFGTNADCYWWLVQTGAARWTDGQGWARQRERGG